MRESVRAGFIPFTSPLEGVVDFLYCDVKGLVTTAIGNLVDPVDYALVLPFVRPDGSYAEREEIRDAWLAVKARQDLKLRGGMAYRDVTTLRLTKEGIAAVVGRKLDQNDAYLRARFSEFEEWPADAQLATHSMAWACGPAFRFPVLEAALRAQNFSLAAIECTINETGNAGIRPRNVANRTLYTNAARVLAFELDRSVLWYPRAVGSVSPEAETLPELPALEEDGGQARKDATSDVVHDAAAAEVEKRSQNESD